MSTSTKTSKNPVTAAASTTTAAQRDQHREWLLELTAIPTAAGHEHRVIKWIDSWVKRRKNLKLARDQSGNLFITHARPSRAKNAPRPVFITAHLDHPAFVVTKIISEYTVELEFRGGVHDPYFENAAIEIIDAKDRAHAATISTLDSTARPFKRVTAELREPAGALKPGDIGRWQFPEPSIEDGRLHTHACDDLAAAAAALGALDVLHRRKGMEHVGLLFTLAEEVGFIGTLAACKHKSIPKKSRLICLENSRSFAESPIGAGPILRVGDRISVFDPRLTNRIGDLILEHQKNHPAFKWQRKLMPGGACEATAFSAYGYESTCICLPLGNYHNMRDIDGVLAGGRPAEVGREFIAVDDYHGLVDMLILTCEQLDTGDVKPIRQRMDAMYKERAFVLDTVREKSSPRSTPRTRRGK